MNNLVDFYWNKVFAINQSDRYSTVLEFDDTIVVNFDCIYDREGTIRAKDQLTYYLHTIGKGRRFIFMSEDGAVLSGSGALSIVNNIIKTFNLTIDTCLVVCRESLSIHNATVKIIDSVPYWCMVLYPTIKNIPIPAGNFNKKFAVWFNRGTIFRLQLAKHLYENYKDTSIISYQESGIIIDRKMKKYYQDLIEWANQHTPIVYDQIFPNREYTHEMIVGAARHPYNDYFIEIVCETEILSTAWVTEKTVKNLYIGKPFLVMTGQGILDKLRSYGFQTFSPWIDESYDLIENHNERLLAILAEIDRLASIDINKLYENIKPILDYNRTIYINLIKKEWKYY